MSGNVQVGNRLTRPNFRFHERHDGTPYEEISCQLLESIRNLLEDIQQSQMMQCDVAWAIKETRDILKHREREENARYLQRNGFKEAAAKLLRRKK